MDELVFIKKDQAVCTSLQVAEKFQKRHDTVLRSVDEIMKNSSPQKCGQFFKDSFYKDSSGKKNRMFFMTRDGFALLAMGFNGKKALEWKYKYIEAFNMMEHFISERNTTAWLETRKYGKLTRKAETDTLKALVEYAKEQGSSHSDKLYMVYSKLADRFAGIEKRDAATINQLNNVSLAENVILHIIDTGIMTGANYKDIYKDCKKRLSTINELAYLSS